MASASARSRTDVRHQLQRWSTVLCCLWGTRLGQSAGEGSCGRLSLVDVCRCAHTAVPRLWGLARLTSVYSMGCVVCCAALMLLPHAVLHVPLQCAAWAARRLLHDRMLCRTDVPAPCRRQCIDLGMLAGKLNMEPEAAEKWIVNLIRSARLSAKLDSQVRPAAVS